MILDETYKDKMIKTLLSTKSTHWQNDETNHKRNRVVNKTKMISLHVYSFDYKMMTTYPYEMQKCGYKGEITTHMD